MGMIESGMKNTEAAREMREKYLVSPEKTALAVTIANREREILKDIDYKNGYSLYIGIPFCKTCCYILPAIIAYFICFILPFHTEAEVILSCFRFII